ncbi:MAG: hypothetical protein AAF985_03270 [Bacteroidota bacterium]
MHSPIRKDYNQKFTTEKYEALKNYINEAYDHTPPFRIAETPVFVPSALRQQLVEACEEISDLICQPNFKELSQGAILAGQVVPGEDDHTLFLQMDFGICRDPNGGLIPQLIEVQGFPSLYFFQDLLAKGYKRFFDIPDNYNHFFGGLDSQSYMELLLKNIVGDSDPKNVVLLEVEPEKQATRIDFYGAVAELGIKLLCVSQLKKEGKDLYYLDEAGVRVAVKKIVNRVIFDELIHRDGLSREFYFTEEANVEWIGHPHWFFRISKHTLPLIKSKYNPPSVFLNDLEQIPTDLENYVLKPLYSFAGTGVLININQYDLDAIKDRENYILQRKVEYAPIVETPSEYSKCEIRMLMLWEKGAARPRIVNNLARLSKGEMIGVRYNKNKDWVGASVAFFEQD